MLFHPKYNKHHFGKNPSFAEIHRFFVNKHLNCDDRVDHSSIVRIFLVFRHDDDSTLDDDRGVKIRLARDLGNDLSSVQIS